MEYFEEITWQGKSLAYIIRESLKPEKTTFPIPAECNLQVGFVVYPAGGEITPHLHRPLERHIIGTSEVLVVRKGCCEVDIYSEDKQLVATRKLESGDILVLVSGGHGFRILEDIIFLEVKQGPYTGLDEKERFKP